MHTIKRYVARYRRPIIVGQSFKLVEAVLELLLPLVMAQLIDQGIRQADRGVIFSRGWLMFGIAAVGMGTALVCQVVASRASQDFGTELRRDLFAHMQTLSHADVDQFGTPSMITRLISDVNQLQYALAMLIRLVVRAPFLAVGSIGMALILDRRLSLIFLITTPLIALLLYWVMKRSVPFFRMLQKNLDRIARIARENLEGIRVIRAFSRQGHETARFEQTTQTYADTAVRVGLFSALLNPATTVIMNAGILAILWIGGQQVNQGFLSQGVLIAFINYMIQIALQTAIVANLVVIFTKAAASMHRVEEVMERKPSVADTAQSLPDCPSNAPALEMRDVSFAYPTGGANALEHLTFRVERGETVGVIGGTGSGKSTLAGLVARFYDVQSGEVRVFGAPVASYPLEALRAQIGFVPQHAALVSGSIRKNLRWGDQDATDEELWNALEVAQAAPFVKNLSGQLDALVEEGGKNLSGGQRQRLTIARALVRKPKILILDDSASALDYATEAALRRALAQDRADRTVLLISQRAATVRHADRIVVLEDGRLAGIGDHASLMESCAVYREICLSQLSQEEASK